MKLLTNFFIIAAVASSLCSSCTLETSGNGNLDGMWHLVAVDTIVSSKAENVSERRIYWSFQNKLLMLEDKAGTNTALLLRFEHKDSGLRLYDPYIYDRENGDKKLEDTALLKPYGVDAAEQTFSVDKLSGSKMVLSSETLRLKFEKR